MARRENLADVRRALGLQAWKHWGPDRPWILCVRLAYVEADAAAARERMQDTDRRLAILNAQPKKAA